ASAGRRANDPDLPGMDAILQPDLSTNARGAADGIGVADPSGSLARTLGARGVIAFDQQLRAIVAAVSFASPDRARVTNLRGAQRDIVVSGERDTFSGLTFALYADHYSLLP